MIRRRTLLERLGRVRVDHRTRYDGVATYGASITSYVDYALSAEVRSARAEMDAHADPIGRLVRVIGRDTGTRSWE